MGMVSVLRLLMVMVMIPFGRSQTSCTSEATLCFADDVCSSCADVIQSLIESGSIDTDVTDCDEFSVRLCSMVDTDECDITNEVLLSLAQCVLEEEYGCSGFTTCDDIPDMSGTDSPTAAPTSAPTASPDYGTDNQPSGRYDSGASAGVMASSIAALLGTLAALFVV